MLYIIMFLHQTTTRTLTLTILVLLYIIMFLHQTTTWFTSGALPTKLYIIMFLHQTTTDVRKYLNEPSCILSCPYIKPQPF